MANTKEVRKQIASIKSTQKITSAMEMVAASKIRKTQSEMQLGRPYSEKIKEVISHIATSSSEYSHPFYENRDAKKACFIVVSSDKGLCGGLNINLFKTTLKAVKELQDQGVEVDLCLVGAKAASFFKSVGGNVVAAKAHLGDEFNAADLIGTVKVMLDAFDEGKLDRLFVVNNKFVNTMTQQPTIAQLLPLEADEGEEFTTHWDYIYEPDDAALLEGLLMRYVESQVYQGLVENNACEQAARMIAMKSATDNAGDMIDGLQLIYNKARQASITQELSEIVSGASAV